MTLYERIRHRREQLGISQGQLAEELGYTNRSTIAKIESGKNDITQSKIVAFAHALDTTPQYLMGWTDDPYDYDTDPNGVLAEIPSNAFRELMELYSGDLEAVWRAWQAVINDHYEEPQSTYDITPPEYEMVCAYRVADDDTKSIVDTALKRYKKAPASEDAGDDAPTYQAAARSGDRVDVNRVSLEEELAALPPKRKRDI